MLNTVNFNKIKYFHCIVVEQCVPPIQEVVFQFGGENTAESTVSCLNTIKQDMKRHIV